MSKQTKSNVRVVPFTANMTQHERLFALLSDNRPHRTDEIVNVVYPSANICFICGRGDTRSLARVGARIWDLKNGKWSGKKQCLIRGWNDEKNHSLHWYQMDVPAKHEIQPVSLVPAFKAVKQTNSLF